jgi:hypothetical protein
MSSAGSIYVDLLLRDAQYAAGWKRATRTTQTNTKAIDNAIRALVTGASLTAFSTVVKNAVNAADQLGEAATRVGTSASNFQKLAFAAKLSGLEVKTLETGLRFLNKQVAEGKLPYENLEQAIADVADRVRQTTDPIERNAILIEAYGARAGSAFTELASKGSEGIAELGRQAERLGIVLDDNLVRKAAEVNDQLDIIGLSISRNFQAGLLAGFVDESQALSDIYSDPALVEGIRDVAGAVGEMIGFVLRYGREAATILATFAGAASGAVVGGAAGSVIPGIGTAIGAAGGAYIGGTQAFARAGMATGTFDAAMQGSSAAEQKKIADLLKKNEEILKNGATFKTGSSGSIDGTYKNLDDAAAEQKKALEELGRIYDQNIEYLDGLDEATRKYQKAVDDMDKLLEGGIINSGEYSLALLHISEEYERNMAAANEWGVDLEAVSKRAAENMQDAFADFLFDPFSDGLDGMLKGFVDTMRKMLAEQTSKQLFGSLFGGSGGGGIMDALSYFTGSGSVSSQVSGLVGFSGLFAEGGYIPPGGWGIVGEGGGMQHAEAIYGGKTGATVIPQGKMGGGNNYVFNVGGDVSQTQFARLEAMVVSTVGPGKIEQRVVNAQKRGSV